MLAVQIQYWTLREAERHNRATEAETARHNIIGENQNLMAIEENKRHNIVSEFETQRHNIATEDYYNNALLETSRHNRETEAVAYLNAANEFEKTAVAAYNAKTNRLGVSVQKLQSDRQYNLGLEANRIAQYNARTNAYNAVTSRRSQQQEQSRIATANITSLSNSLSTAKKTASEVSNTIFNQNLNTDKYRLDKSRFNWERTNDLIKAGSNIINGAVSAYSKTYGYTR